MTLMEFLSAEYGQPNYSRRSGLEACLRIDDGTSADVYARFCTIHLRQQAESDGLTLELNHPPVNEQVRCLVENNGGTIQDAPLATTARLPIHASNAQWLRDLAKAIRKVVGRGQRYDDRNWKWICPRTADALEGLGRLLRQYRSTERQAVRSGKRVGH